MTKEISKTIYEDFNRGLKLATQTVYLQQEYATALTNASLAMTKEDEKIYLLKATQAKEKIDDIRSQIEEIVSKFK